MEDNAKLSPVKVYLGTIVAMIVEGAILFLSAGSFRYWEAWVVLAWGFPLIIIGIAYFLKKSPDLVLRRSRYREEEPSQKAIGRLYPILILFGYIIPGLDYRYHWSSVPIWLVIASNVILLSSCLVIFFVFRENRYASSVIRVEKDQPVITTGPYAVVRHPIYAGTLAVLIFAPLALGSYWTLIPFLFFVPLLILRLLKEEEVLLRDLPGYGDYCLKTRYRLIPLIW